MREVHRRLRAALRLTQETLDRASPDQASLDEPGDAVPAAVDDLLLYCRGFCAALDGHHRGEDRTLFPAIAAAHPHLRPVLRSLQQDHSMIAHLLGGLRAAVDRSAGAAELRLHLAGVAAIMENHFRYEEQQLLTVLAALDLRVTPAEALGPL